MTTLQVPPSPSSITSNINFPPESSPKSRICAFVDDLYDILITLNNEAFTEIAQIACIRAYNFSKKDENGNATENPSLADCMNTILRDRNTFDRNDKMFYFFELMVLQFFKKSVQRMIISDNSVPPMPDDFDEKLHTAIDNFKSCGEA